MVDKKVRHVLGISGGKDSAALAIYLKDQGHIPEMEYFFTDTGAELPEVYDYLYRLEDYLGKKIARLNNGRDFEHHLILHGNLLPSPRQRWCTLEMKIKPFEQFIGDDECVSYIGIRADEDREGYISTRPNIKPVFPFKEDGLIRADIFRILEDSVGIPEYYQWRSRSGCYFCFFQRRSEWLGLAERHPDLFEKAKQFEKYDEATGQGYTWVQGMSLDELVKHAKNIKGHIANKGKLKKNLSWQEIMQEEDEQEDDEGCLICHL